MRQLMFPFRFPAFLRFTDKSTNRQIFLPPAISEAEEENDENGKSRPMRARAATVQLRRKFCERWSTGANDGQWREWRPLPRMTASGANDGFGEPRELRLAPRSPVEERRGIFFAISLRFAKATFRQCCMIKKIWGCNCRCQEVTR